MELLRDKQTLNPEPLGPECVCGEWVRAVLWWTTVIISKSREVNSKAEKAICLFIIFTSYTSISLKKLKGIYCNSSIFIWLLA